MSLLGELEAELESARAELERMLDEAAPELGISAIDLPVFNDDSVDDVTVDKRTLKRLMRDLDDIGDVIASALRDHDWRVARALKAFKRALARETTP